MKNILSIKYYLTWDCASKILITSVLYYLSADIAYYLRSAEEVFKHQRYAIYWPPSGICFMLMILWGPKIWPGIIIGSLLRTTDTWMDLSHLELISTALLISLFAIGRVLEPIAGQALLKRIGIHDAPFKGPLNTFYFILVSIGIAIISSGLSALGAELQHKDSIEILLMRTFGWYIDNLIAILIFAPLTYAIVMAKPKSWLKLSTIIPILLMTLFTGFVIIYFPLEKLSSIHIVLESAFPFLIIPLLLWISFNFNFVITSYSVFVVSIITIYFTSHGLGPFIYNGNYQHAVWILQSFLFVISIASLVSYSASKERREDLRQLEEAKVKAEESDRLKSSFLANMSHEIRTPMNAVMGFSELLSRPDLSITKREEFAHLIRQRSKDLLAIVNDILDISKIESGQIVSKPSKGNIAELLDQLLTNFSAEVNHLHGKAIVVKTSNELNGDENNVVADFTRLHQVMSNLLNNALKFTESGSIEFGCKLQNGDTLLFYVHDTGMGIESSKHEIIFKPFQQASATTHQQYGGTGLGLAIIKGLIRLWNGNIWVESEIGKGSTFYFTMPYLQEDRTMKLNQLVDHS